MATTLNTSPEPAKQTGRLARKIRAAFVLVTLLVATLTTAWWASRPATPDEFYAVAPPQSAVPGTLLRSAPLTKAVPAGARAWLILYTTTRTDGSAAAASAVILASRQSAGGPRPVIAWAHGTTGIAPGCAPSVMANPFVTVPALDRLIQEDWIYVATDYAGLGTPGGHAYLVGDDAARAVLDAVRAARQLEGIALDHRIVVWGHSQGGNAALWTGGRAAAYAPDVPLSGVAALAPATNLVGLVASTQSSMFGKIVSSYLVSAYGDVYADVGAADYLRGGIKALVGDIASRCAGRWSTLFSMFESALLLPRNGIFSQDPTSGPLGRRLSQNTPNAPISAPVLVAQGTIDDLVLASLQSQFVAARCAAGQSIDYRTYAGLDHLSLVARGSPLEDDLIAWSRDRLAGKPASDGCRR
jgi:alpha-beta hydrolase superfamily lysophospholipase